MAKDKKRLVDESEQKETVFYYEITGFILILFSFITLGKLGSIGSLIGKLIKVLFGDFYWLFLILLLLYGVYLLFMHNKISIKNTKCISTIMISIIILIVSHFPVHNYLSSFEDKSYITLLLSFYKEYLNGFNVEYLGGGLIGAFIFFGINYLFGITGVIIIVIISIILSISLFFNKPIFEIGKSFIIKGKSIKKYFKNFNNFFKYEIGKNETKEKSFYNKSKVPVKFLNDIDESVAIKMQEKKSLEIKSIIKSVLKNYNISYNDLDIYVSYKITTFNFIIYDHLDNEILQVIINKLSDLIEYDMLYSYLEEGNYNQLLIQIANEYLYTLTLHTLLLKCVNIYGITNPLGITYNNEIFEYDEIKTSSILLLGNHHSGIRTFINAQIIKNLIKGGLKKYEFIFFDPHNTFNIFDGLGENNISLDSFFNNINRIIEDRLSLFVEKKVNTYNEYNNVIMKNEEGEELKKVICIINEIYISDIEGDSYKYIVNKLNYITQFSKKIGIELIYVIREHDLVDNLLLSAFDLKIIFNSTNELSNKVINNDNAYYLQGEGDAIAFYKSGGTRIQTPLITDKEIHKILSYLK